MPSTETLAFFTGAVGLLSAVAMGFYAFRNSASSVKNDVINTYEKRVKQLENSVEELMTKVDEMKTMLEKSEAERMKAQDILNLRNPEFEQYMAVTLKMLTEIHGAVMPQTVSHK